MEELYGKPLRYLIACDDQLEGDSAAVVEVGYDGPMPSAGVGVRYGNLFDQTGSGKYGPYTKATGTASRYSEKKLNWKGKGWAKLHDDQFKAAKKAGFKYIELDNPDGYDQEAVMDSCDRVAAADLKLIAKNAQLLDDPVEYLKHQAVVGCIIEKDEDHDPSDFPEEMDKLRKSAGKPLLPIWFVTFGDGRRYADGLAKETRNFQNMGVTYSGDEYDESADIAKPQYTGASNAPVAPPLAPVAPSPKTDGKLISQAAIDLIVEFEVSSRDEYERKYHRPEWPGGASGVTIGIGYDVGAGCDSFEQLKKDWGGQIPDKMIEALRPAIGVTGGSAEDLLDDMRDKVNVPWVAAMEVFEKVDVPRWYSICQRKLPHFDELPPDCTGALVSLAYNRGASFDADGDRYREMRAIKADMAARNFADIPKQLRAMKRIWEGRGQGGLLRRREQEAVIFEKGIGAQGKAADFPYWVEREGAQNLKVIRAPLDDFTGRIIRAMQAHSAPPFNCQVDIGEDIIMIPYIEGCSPGGIPNDHVPNHFDDLRMVIRKRPNGIVEILGQWEATTRAGRYYERVHLLNSGGAFHVSCGRQCAWTYGNYHHGDYPALLNTEPLYGTRDAKMDYERRGPVIHEQVGAHHHWGYDFPHDDIKTAGAGCLVGRMEKGHMEFIGFCRGDRRFKENRGFLWPATVMPVQWLIDAAA